MNTDVLVEMTDTELDAILGAGDGVVKIFTHECHLNFHVVPPLLLTIPSEK